MNMLWPLRNTPHTFAGLATFLEDGVLAKRPLSIGRGLLDSKHPSSVSVPLVNPNACLQVSGTR